MAECMCGRKKTKSMVNKEIKTSQELDNLINDLKRHIAFLEEDLQVKNIEIMQLRASLNSKK
jgi:hypothetical protein